MPACLPCPPYLRAGIKAFSIHSHVHSMFSSSSAAWAFPRHERPRTWWLWLLGVTSFSLTTDLKPTEGSPGRQRIAFPTWTWKLSQLVKCCSGCTELSTNAGLQFVFREQIALFTTCAVDCFDFVSYQSSSQKASFISKVQSRTEFTIVPGWILGKVKHDQVIKQVSSTIWERSNSW